MSAPHWIGPQQLVEAEDSPQWTYGERIICRRVFRGPYQLCVLSAPRRGAVGVGDMMGLRVAQATVSHGERGTGILTVDYEPSGEQPPDPNQQVPAPELRVDCERTEVDLRKHPRYASVSEEEHLLIKTLLETASNTPEFTDAAFRLQDSRPIVRELFQKLVSGQTHYICYAPVVTRVRYHLMPPQNMTMGGYIESPPQGLIDYPRAVYLRAADSLRWNGSYWEERSQWIGADGWDTDIYSPT